jgi:capsular polysaccharide biosynthesis protein/Mrp family chromosome partitioning ATPase
VAFVDRVAQALRARGAVIAVAVVAVTIIAYGLALIAGKRYSATARIVASPPAAGTYEGSDARRLATNVALVKSAPVLAAAGAKLPDETASSLVEKVTTRTAADADVIDITASDDDAEGAAAIANGVAAAFLDRRAANARATLARTRGALAAQIAALGPAAERAPQVAALRARVDDIAIQSAVAGNDLQLAAAAQVPSRPDAPRPLRTAAAAFLAALVVVVLIVAEREWRRPVARARDAERLAGVPLLAALPAVPRVRVWDRWLEGLAARAPPRLRKPVAAMAARRRRARDARCERVRMATDDGLRSLLAATLLTLPPGDRHVILVTSAERGQRSADLAASLARGLAQVGQDTLVLSSDLASGQLADALGVAPEPGLSQALEQAQGGTAVQLRAVPVPGLDALHVVPSGGPSQDGVGLVRPGAADALFAALGDSGYRYVIVDAPGLLVAPEGSLVARIAEAAILAFPEDASPDELAEARRALERMDVGVLGAVSLSASAAQEPTPR